MEGDDYYEMGEGHALAQTIDSIETALRDKDDGRNAAGWPLGSFGGKDADLEPEGCAGIQAIAACTETIEGYLLHIVVGGHKMFCDPCETLERDCSPEEREWLREAVFAAVYGSVFDTDGRVEADGSDWTVSWSITLEVPWIDEMPEVITDRIIVAAMAALEPFQLAMAKADGAIDAILHEIA